MLLEFHFFEEISFVFRIFLVSGIVDKINDMTNNKVIETSVQNVMLESSSSPNDTVKYVINLSEDLKANAEKM